jgi:hypothetical protein
MAGDLQNQPYLRRLSGTSDFSMTRQNMQNPADGGEAVCEQQE